MTAQLRLPTCVLPGCDQQVGDWGIPCQGCIDAFGPIIQHEPEGRRMTAEEIEDRDTGTRRAYRTARLRGTL